jgi:hypothetical protein
MVLVIHIQTHRLFHSLERVDGVGTLLLMVMLEFL